MTTPIVTAPKMTAADHYEIADEVRRGDLRRIGMSFADHQERTKKARGEVRYVIGMRERPLVHQPPESRRAERQHRGLKVSPVKHVLYRSIFGVDSLTQVKIDARAKWEAKRVSLVSAAFLPAYESCGYRRSQSSWAGGDHAVNVRVVGKSGSVNASGENNRAWSKNGKWSGNNSTHTFHVRMDWLNMPESARVVSGLLTLELGHMIAPNIYTATWVEQGRGVMLNVVHGWLVWQRGHWLHADTFGGARRLLAGSIAPKPTFDLSSLNAFDLLKRARLMGEERVTIETAHEAGNCFAGIRDWCAKHGIDTATETSVTSLEIAKLAVASQDRLREVYAVLLQVAKVKRATRSSECQQAAAV